MRRAKEDLHRGGERDIDGIIRILKSTPTFCCRHPDDGEQLSIDADLRSDRIRCAKEITSGSRSENRDFTQGRIVTVSDKYSACDCDFMDISVCCDDTSDRGIGIICSRRDLRASRIFW